MNSLSWFLYAIDVIGNVKALLIGFGILALICFICLNLAVIASEGEVLDWPHYKKNWWRSIVVCAAFLFAATALPSSNTMYAIAASQVGEKVIASERVQGFANDATKALEQWIKRQIEPENKK